MNFAWWVNRVDSAGNNVFEGGFLGLDNITVVDRSEKLPGGAVLEQSDATGWMGFFCLYLMRAALELAKYDEAYELLATKFFEHFIYVGAAMKKMGGRRLSAVGRAGRFLLRCASAAQWGLQEISPSLHGRPHPAVCR